VKILAYGLAASLLVICASTSAQTTAFTYQGRLNDLGSPADGSYDLRFALFDDSTNGSQQGPILTNTATAVTNGLFTVTLDFGSQFPGGDRWLEIAVQTNGVNGFIPLAPRQHLTPVPYALWAGTASNLLGTLPAAQLSGAIPATNITGTLSLAQLPGAVVTNTTVTARVPYATGWTNSYTISDSPLTFENLTVTFCGPLSINGALVYTNTASSGQTVYLDWGDPSWVAYNEATNWVISSSWPDEVVASEPAGYANMGSATDANGNTTNLFGNVWQDGGEGPTSIRILAQGTTQVINGTLAGNASSATVSGNGIDPLAESFADAQHLAPDARSRLDAFCQRVRTMAAFTNMQVHFLFNPAYAPAANVDLFGNYIVWSNEPTFGPWGANCSLVNQGKILLPAQAWSTNWTIVVVKRNYNAGFQPHSGHYYWENEFALENTNGDSFNFGWAGPIRGGNYFVPTYNGAIAYNSNAVNFSPFSSFGSDNHYNMPEEVAPSIWCFESTGGKNITGSIDMLTIGPGCLDNSAINLINLSPVQVITVGGSTNWQNLWAHNTNSATDQPTNALCEVYSVTYFNTAISRSDLQILYTALNGEYTSNKHWIGLGDSMMNWHSNYIYPYDSYGACTNFIMFNFSQRHPNDNWHDWAQGGTTIGSFTTNLPTQLVTLLPAGSDVTIIEDLGRNDLLVTDTSYVNYDSLRANFNAALAPWKATGAKVWQYESVLPATNAGPFLPGSPARTNLVDGYAALRTGTLVDRFLHGIDYFTGSVWDTNNGYFGYSADSFMFAGVHIEGTNSPVFMAEMAALWDTGEWPGLMPQLDPTLNGLQSSGNFAGSFTGDGSGLTSLNASQLTGTVPAAALPGITTNVSTAGITFYITNGLIMRVSTP
jgi:hypothetical protein